MSMQETGKISSESQPQTAPVMAYATPEHLRAGATCWREGLTVVVVRGSVHWPKYCFKCGAACEKTREVKVHSAYAWINRNQTRVEIPLCERHDKTFRMLKRIPWIVFLVASAGLFILGGIFKRLNPLAVELVAFVFWGVVMLALILEQRILNFVVRAKRVDAHFVALKGAGKEFLEKLPER